MNTRSVAILLPLLGSLLAAACGTRDQELATVRNSARSVERAPATARHVVADSAIPSVPPAQDTAAAAVAIVADSLKAVPEVGALDVDQLALSVPMSFEVTAKVSRDVIHLRSDELSDMAGIACTGGEAAPTRGSYEFDLLRFAHFGRADSPYAFRWVLYMPKGEGKLVGKRMANGRYEVELRGMLKFDVIMKGATQPIRTATPILPVFRGVSKSWPPYGVELTLANGPIPFFSDRQRRDSGVAPMVAVLETKFTIGKRPTEYFARAPRIERAAVVDGAGAPWKGGRIGGVELRWESVSRALQPVAIAGYNIYRSTNPENPASWERIATVPSSQTTLRDSAYNGKGKVAYMVTHRADYPTGYEYEGIRTVPAIVEAVR